MTTFKINNLKKHSWIWWCGNRGYCWNHFRHKCSMTGKHILDVQGHNGTNEGISRESHLSYLIEHYSPSTASSVQIKLMILREVVIRAPPYRWHTAEQSPAALVLWPWHPSIHLQIAVGVEHPPGQSAGLYNIIKTEINKLWHKYIYIYILTFSFFFK